MLEFLSIDNELRGYFEDHALDIVWYSLNGGFSRSLTCVEIYVIQRVI